MLFCAQVVIAELRGGIGHAARIGRRVIKPRRRIDVDGRPSRVDRRLVIEVANVLDFEILIEKARREIHRRIEVAADAYLMRPTGHLVLHACCIGGVTALDHARIATDGGIPGVRRRSVAADTVVVTADEILALVTGNEFTDVGVAGVIDTGIHVTVEERTGVDEIQRADAAVEGPRRLFELVSQRVGLETLDLQIPHVRIVVKDTLGFELLRGVLQQGRPVVIDGPLQAHPDTTIVRGIDVILDHGRVIGHFLDHRDVHTTGAHHRPVGKNGALRIVNTVPGERRVDGRVGLEGAFHVIDVTALVIVIQGRAEGQLVGNDRDIDHGFEGVRISTLMGLRVAARETGLELVQNGLVGDQAHGAGHGTGAVERALRTGQHLDSLHISDEDIQVATAGRDRLLVKIQGHVGR